MLRWAWPLLTLITALTLGGCRAPFIQVSAASSDPLLAPSTPKALRLEDVTAASGVRFRHHTGAFGRKWFPETNGSGAAIFDYDGDGSPDLFLVNDRDWSPAERIAAHQPAPRDLAPHPTTPRLFRNQGNGTFTDVTHAVGLDIPMYGMGCAVGDYNNDGFPDLYVSGVGRGWLFRNEGGRRFREVAAPAGVVGSGWGTSCAWLDADRDGYLDLFVCHYVQWNPRDDSPCDGGSGQPVYCGPNLYRPEPCRLYHNNRDGTFTDVSKRAGIWSHAGHPLISKAMGVAVCDVDDDGWPDLAIANDTERNLLFRNNHNDTFTEEGLETGMALPEEGQARSGMGIDAADWEGSGHDGLVIGNFWDETLSLYRSQGHGAFTDQAHAAGVSEPSRPFTTFGCLFVDLDNDGWLDIAAANGHIDNKAEEGTVVPLAQRPLFLLNRGGKSFHETRLYDHPIVGRGLAAGDWDRDGAVDLLLTTNGGPPVLLRNAGGVGSSVRLVLEGTRSNRSGIGAELIARVGGHILKRRVRSGSSYLSASELPVTLGMGSARQVDRLTVRWLSGHVDELRGLAAGREYQIREGTGITRTIALSSSARFPGKPA